MADSDFWRELAEKFRAIEDRFDLLHAEWKKFESNKWSLVDEALAARPSRASISTRFEALARRGGTRLDSSRDSLHVWLDGMKAEGRWTEHEVRSNLNASGELVEPPVLMACWIMRLCKSSAEFCDILESRTIENERIAGEKGREENEPRLAHSVPEETNIDTDPVAAERKTILAAFKLKGRRQGIHVTDEMVAQAANPGKWNDRTMVTRWKRNDARIESIHDRKIRAVLARNPSDLWPPKPKPQKH